LTCNSEPTVFENYVHDIFIDQHHVELSLWDTAGQEEFDRLRSLSYDDTHALMLCFSVDSPESLENVESKWVGEIAENCPGVKLVLCALKCDLREGAGADDEEGEEGATEGKRKAGACIDYKQGLAVAERIKALRYLGMFACAHFLGFFPFPQLWLRHSRNNTLANVLLSQQNAPPSATEASMRPSPRRRAWL